MAKLSTTVTAGLIIGLTIALSGTAALALGEPIPGIDIVVKKDPSGLLCAVQGDGGGGFVLKDLAPGRYVLLLGGSSLRRAIKRLDRSGKNADHLVGVRIGTLSASELSIGSGESGADARVAFTVPADAGGPAHKHVLKGIVTLVR